jgi:small ligand-binding sensory domain FIST
VVTGCTAAKLVADRREIEQGPGLVLWAASLPDTRLKLHHLEAEARQVDPDGRVQAGSWHFRGLPTATAATSASALLLADPFTFPVVEFLDRAGELLPGVRIFGGVASGAETPGRNRLILTDGCAQGGAVLLVFEEGVRVSSLVSQGCRPIGTPLVITACDGHRITKLRGRGAARVLMETIGELPEAERDLFRRGAFVGLAVDATKSAFEPGDLLVRQVAGLEPKEDAIAVVDDSLRPGMSVQFLVRDADSASEELARLLDREAPTFAVGEEAQASERGALLFTCTGRGERMFGRANHDAESLQGAFGPDLPLAGFFAGGEIGPVGPRSYLHGFSATVALFGGSSTGLA